MPISADFELPTGGPGGPRGQVVVRDGIYVREEVMMLVLRLPTAGLQVTAAQQGTGVAYAFQEQEMKSLGCWDFVTGVMGIPGDTRRRYGL